MKEKEIDNIEKDSKGLSALMRLIRPKQWIKNGFIFMPLFFGGELFNTGALLAGGVATGVVLSKWIVLMTFLITLFMSFAKRRDDVIRMEKTGEAPRKNTSRYNLTFINQAITITASVTLVCYIMYTVSPEVLEHFHTDKLYLTTVFVLVGLLRYIQIAVVDQQSGDPTKILLRDRITQVIVVAWLAAFLFLIYIA